MPIPLSVLVFARGANGIPTRSNHDNLRGKLDSWEQRECDRFGYESARGSFKTTVAEALSWARPDYLRRHCEVYTPKARRCWEGYLCEIEVVIGNLHMVLSLKDMANRLVVRYNTSSSGAQSASTAYTNAASIATYGRKDRLLNLSNTSPTGADNRAQTALNMIAFPRNKQPSEAATGPTEDCTVTLTFAGYYGTLDELLTSNTSTTVTATNTQLLALLAAYNAVNNWFSTDAANVVSTGVNDTESIDPDTTYRDKIETLLAQGDSAHERLFWGCFDDRAFTVKRWAGATPEQITYYESSKTGQIRDTWGNVVEPWDVRADCMVRVSDLLDVELPDDATDSTTRKYVARVTLRIDRNKVSVKLDPDNVDSLEQILSSPTGAGPAGTSDRQAAVERSVQQANRTRFPAGDHDDRYSDGTWQPGAGGTGVKNTGTINTRGGNVDNTGGNDVDLGTGTGIGGAGSSAVKTSGGTPGAIPKWQTATELSNAVAGTDYSAPGHTHAPGDTTNLNEAIDDRVAALLVAGANISLSYNDPSNTLTISTSGVPDGSGTAGRIAQWQDSNTLEASTLVKSGAGVLTLSASGAVTLTIDSTTRLDGSGAASGDVLTWNGTAYAPAAPPVTGSGANTRVAFWSGAGTLTNDTAFTWDATNNRLSIGELITAAGVRWNFGSAAAGGGIIAGRARVTIAGTDWDVLLDTPGG